MSRIRELNDAFRTTFVGGEVMCTRGIQALPPADLLVAIKAVQGFSDFTPDNDPHGEHDFGSFEVNGTKCYWKIDYYDKKMEYGSENPEDPKVTTRVLTILLVEEY